MFINFKVGTRLSIGFFNLQLLPATSGNLALAAEPDEAQFAPSAESKEIRDV